MKSNLSSVVRNYKSRYRQRARDELEFFAQLPTLSDAIEYAAFAKDGRGKRFSHQRRLKVVALQRAHSMLWANSYRMNSCTNFAELYETVDVALQRVAGIGELYVYDTTLRLGAHLKLSPDKIYLHAGTRVGAEALGLDGRAQTLEVRELPNELHELEPHEIEDVLCIYKSLLHQFSDNPSE